MIGRVAAALNRSELDIAQRPVAPEALAQLLKRDRRRHDLRQDRQGRVRRDVGAAKA
jgi:hypothetical protein